MSTAPQKNAAPERIRRDGVEYVRADLYKTAAQLVIRQANEIRSLRNDITRALRNHPGDAEVQS